MVVEELDRFGSGVAVEHRDGDVVLGGDDRQLREDLRDGGSHVGVGVGALQDDVGKVRRAANIIQDLEEDVPSVGVVVKVVESSTVLPGDQHLGEHHSHTVHVHLYGLSRSDKGHW